MAEKNCKVCIVEGEVREPVIINNIIRIFFAHDNVKIITLPAGQNIYMLWKKLKADDTPQKILELENMEIAIGRVFILSAFPEFLLDYFGKKLWITAVKRSSNELQHYGCRS
ncbi:MAG: hypothetical protein LUH20_02040 [Lachnospiraceae bacterium]|nr:hypothetical protein [Lachnospiraceae bacterium]